MATFAKEVNSKLVILESNWGTQKIFENNKPNSFVTKFFEPLDFTGAWEVAIASISFPFYVRNVDENIRVFHCYGTPKEINGKIMQKNIQCKSFYVPAGYYNSPQELGDIVAAGINLVTKKTKLLPVLAEGALPSEENVTDLSADDERSLINPEIFFEFDHNLQKMSVACEVMAFFFYVWNKSKLFDLLGLDYDGEEPFQFVVQPGKVEVSKTSKHPALKTYQMMKVYVDCIEETVVANLLTQEIGTVSIPSGTSGQTLFIFPNLNYVPLNKNHLESIKMECFDQYGDPFPIHGGHVHATFLFRRSPLTTL